MGDDETRGLAVRRQEKFQTTLKVRIIERFRRQVEVVATPRCVECLTHGACRIGHLGHLRDQTRKATVDCEQGPPHGRRDRDDRRELGQHLRHYRVDIVHVLDQRAHILAELVHTVDRLEHRPGRPAGGNVETVRFPVQVTAERSREIVEVRQVSPHLVQGRLHVAHIADHVMSRIAHLAHQALHPLNRADHGAEIVAHLEHVGHPVLHELKVLLYRNRLSTDLERY